MKGMSANFDQGLDPKAKGGGGGLGIGDIGLFGADPGKNFILCDGRPAPISTFPKLGSGRLKLRANFAPSTAIPTRSRKARKMAGNAYGVINIGNRDSQYMASAFRSIDNGLTYGAAYNFTLVNNWVIAADPAGTTFFACTEDGYGGSSGGIVQCVNGVWSVNGMGNSNPSAGHTSVFWFKNRFNFAKPDDAQIIQYDNTADYSGALTFGMAACAAGADNPVSGMGIVISQAASQFAVINVAGTGYTVMSTTTTPYSGAWNDIACSSAGVYIAATDAGLLRSANEGASWTLILAGAFHSVAFGGGVFVATGPSISPAMISGDGLTATTLSFGGYATSGAGVCFSKGRWHIATDAGPMFANDNDPTKAFVLTPGLPSDLSIAPRRFYMRGK